MSSAPAEVLHASSRNGSTNSPASGDWDLADTIHVPSRTRAGLFHSVHVNVLAGCTDSCTCEEGQAGKYCAHRLQVDSNEGTWKFRRCVECGRLCWLGRFHGTDSVVAIWICPDSSEHSGHEAATDVLYRPAGPPPYAIGSRGAWRVRS